MQDRRKRKRIDYIAIVPLQRSSMLDHRILMAEQENIVPYHEVRKLAYVVNERASRSVEIFTRLLIYLLQCPFAVH